MIVNLSHTEWSLVGICVFVFMAYDKIYYVFVLKYKINFPIIIIFPANSSRLASMDFADWISDRCF